MLLLLILLDTRFLIIKTRQLNISLHMSYHSCKNNAAPKHFTVFNINLINEQLKFFTSKVLPQSSQLPQGGRAPCAASR